MVEDAPRAERKVPPVITCCVESGLLETGVIRLASSIRKFGGLLSDAEIVAVSPRHGPDIQSETLQAFERLDVEYVAVRPHNRFAWQVYLNKAFALSEAEQRADGRPVAFFDSDMLVLRDPEQLRLADDVDMAACPRDKNIGTTGPGDVNHWYWERVTTLAGVGLDELPWVTTATDSEAIRLYWNAGLFVYRPEMALATEWRRVCEAILDQGGARANRLAFWVDQVALGIAAIAAGARIAHLPVSYNYGIASHFANHVTRQGLADARILHYHDAMSPRNWPWLLDELVSSRPDVHAWLGPQGPLEDPTGPQERALRALLRAERGLQRREWAWRTSRRQP